MKIINNQNIYLLDEIKNVLKPDSKVYLSCNYFTALALFELISDFKNIEEFNVLLNISQEDIDEFNLIQSKPEAVLNLQLNRKYKIRKVIQFIDDKVSIREGEIGNQNILIVDNGNSSTCFILTPLNFDNVALGNIPSDKPIFINSFEDSENQYLSLFENTWNNSPKILNDIVVNLLKLGTKDFSGEEIYKYSIREIFQYSTFDERADQKLEKVGFKDSKVWKLLYNFQKDAVIGAIEKIETFGGCIIADSVGLGKTFEALAVMKYYQLRNDRILVLAPKKLRENWTVYQLNDKRNILSEDRLNYDVLNHTDLSRERGMSGDIDLEMINWGNYDLVVIDESHNFRNNPNVRDKITRYSRLMNDVIRANIRTKVLMLSATPVNNRMNDLKNQIAFITEGYDRALSSYGIDSITQVMRDSQRRFTKWLRDGDANNLDVNSLMANLDGAYFRILDMLTIARSRKHIEKYYDTTEIGKFPKRLIPITISPGIDTKNRFKDINDIYDQISVLSLASYTPLAYVFSEKRKYYEEKYDMITKSGSVFKQVDREQSLIYLMRVNLLKRLESSIHSFKLTLEKLLQLINDSLEQIETHQKGEVNLNLNITDIDLDDTQLEDMLVGGKTKVLIQDIDIIKWRQDLKYDKSILEDLLANIKLIDANRDAKLHKLKSIIEDKLQNPINPNNKKVLIFTAFADTAKYLYLELANWLKTEKGLYAALVTGSGNNKTTMPNCRTDLNSILTNFSPLSKNRKDIYPEEKNHIDILIGTDCISEGQNLQDCDYLINYDIHWNPVRIIQRFGRIDRIGSVNNSVQLVNFYPSEDLDNFIDLVARVSGRMVMLDISATGEDNIISQNSREMQDLDYRRRQLQQLKNQVLDLEDIQGNISITDLTFNDFKIDLEKSTESQLATLKQIPPASYAVVKSNLEGLKPGVIFCLKDTSDNLQAIKLKKNILYPFFLVYISKDGEDIVKANQTKLALDYFRKLCMGNDKVLQELAEEFEKETKNNKKPDTYKKLLETSIQEVVGLQEEIGLDSLATPGGTALVKSTLENENSLNLISYLIIK